MRKALRLLLKTLLGLLLAVVFALAAALLALQFRPVRALIRDKVLAAVRGSLKGDLYFDDVRMPNLQRIELSGITLTDRDGVVVAALPSAVIDLRLRPLFSGQVVVDRVDADHLYVDLADLGDERGLLSLFASDEPPKPSDPNADMSPIRVVVHDLCISEGRLELQPEDARRLSLRHLDTCVAFGMARSLEVAIKTLTSELSQNDQPVLALVAPNTLAKLGALGEAADSAAPSSPLRSALSGQLRFRTLDDLACDIHLGARGASRQTLDALGVDSSFLRPSARLDADVHVAAAKQRIAYRVEIRAPESAAHASGEFDAQHVLWTQLSSEGLELARFSDLELPRLMFQLDTKLDVSKPDVLDLQLELVRGWYGAMALPRTSIRAQRAQDGTLTLRSLEARYASALLTASGKLAADGGIEADAKLSAPDLAELPPLHDAVRGLSGALNSHVQLRRSARGGIDARADVQLRRLELQANRAELLALTLHASGSPLRPVLNANLTGRELFVSGEHIGQADIEVDGGPDRYHVSGRADVGRLALDGWLSEQPPGWAGGLTLHTDIGKGPIAVEVPLARFQPGKNLEVHDLRAQYLDASLFADGQIGMGKRSSSLRFGLVVPDIAALTRKFAEREVPGRAELAGNLHGSIEKPALEVRLKYADGMKLLGKPSQANLHAVVDLGAATAHVELAANAGSAHAKAELDSKWRRQQPLAAALKAAHHTLAVDFGSVSIGALTQPSDPDLRSKFDGLIGGRLTAHGNASQLKLDTQLEARRVRAVGDPSSLDVLVGVKYAESNLSVELKAGDRNGQLAELDFADEVDLEQQIAQPGNPLELVSKTRWKAHADFAERRVRELPVISGLGVSHDYAPLTVTTHAKLEHEPNSEPVGELKTVLRWAPTPGAVELGTCSDDVQGTLTLEGQLHDGQLVVSLNGGTGATTSPKAIELNTGLQAKLADLLAGTPRSLGPLTFDARVRELDLKTTPIACERGSGVLSAAIAARNLFDKRADLDLDVNAKALAWDDNPAADVQLNAHPEAHNVRVAAQIKNGRGQLGVDGRFPIDIRATEPGKMFTPTGPIMLKARLSHMEAAPLLAFVPAFKRVSGTLDGGIDVSGTLQAPVTSGTLQLEDVSFTLPRLGQRFAHLNLKGNLSGRKVRLSQGKVRDLDGRATFDAQLILPSGDAWDADLNVHLRKFPVRKSGVIMGRADANATIELRATPANMDVSVKLSKVAVDLTQDIAQVQSLDQHPEVFFSDNAPKPGRAAEAEKEANAPKTVTHATIKILTTEPIWIRRDDFAVQMTTDLKVVLGDEPPSMTGVIALQRGYISLMGETFEIERGRVIMTGGTNVDPQLEITAKHSDPSGTEVDLEVTGFVTHPELAFTLNGKAVTAGEAVMAIKAGGGGGGGDAQAQMASMAIGMTTGLLSLGARREFGDWIPRLQFEQGAQTRLRVGFEADKLIPKFMRGFVRGAYVEGIWAGDNNSTGSDSFDKPTSATANNSAGEGVLLELMLPKDLVWAGQYGPGTVWSLDLDWRP